MKIRDAYTLKSQQNTICEIRPLAEATSMPEEICFAKELFPPREDFGTRSFSPLKERGVNCTYP